MKKFGLRCLASAVLMIGILGFNVSAAAEAGEIISYGISDTDIILYLADPGEQYELRCQIGVDEAENVESHFIEKEAVPIETIILLDNSLSVTDNYRPLINTVLSELAANRMNGELFTIALFSDQITYLVEQCADYAQMKQAIDGISYNDQETYLTDVLYELLEKISAGAPTTLKRIIIISDGVDNKSIGYTKEELYSQLEKTQYPIYTLGCTYKNNDDQLENMFALSRMTGGEAYLLDEITDPLTIVNGIAGMNRALKITVTPKAQDCDGTTKGISVAVTTADGQTVQDSIEMKMPFGTVEESLPAEEPEKPEVMEEPEIPEEQELPPWIIYTLIASVGIVIIVLIITAVIAAKKKKEKDNRFMPAPPPDSRSMPSQMQNAPRNGNGRTVIQPEQSRRKGTVMIWGQDGTHTLALEDMNNPVRRFEVPLNGSIVIGYNDDCQICLNYEETVSGEHCCIYVENGKFYIQNRSKTNGTFLNGKRVVNAVEVYSGCVLGIGRLNMKVEII